MAQWQREFKGQIRALTQWLKNMEMSLPPLEPRVAEGPSACMAKGPYLTIYFSSLWAEGLWVISSAGPAAWARSQSTSGRTKTS